jgi:hypothetical protein
MVTHLPALLQIAACSFDLTILRASKILAPFRKGHGDWNTHNSYAQKAFNPLAAFKALNPLKLRS